MLNPRQLFSFTLTIALFTAIAAPAQASFSFETVTPEEAGYDSEKLRKISEVADSLYADGRIPNYVLALYRGKQRFFSETRGFTTIGGDSPVTTDTIYPLTSITKPIVTTGLLILVGEGKLSLDDELRSFFPAFSTMMVAPEGDFNNQFEPQNRQITIRDLITHTSGFTYSENIAGFGDVGRTYTDLGLFSPRAGLSLMQHMERLSEVPLVAQPGTEFNYSVSTDVIGAIIEQISGQTLAEYLQQHLFTPLGMSSTGFSVNPEQLNQLVSVYGSEPLSAQLPFSLISNVNDSSGIDWKIGLTIPRENYMRTPSFYSGGGGLLSTPNDFAKYLSMIANDGTFDGRKILTKEISNLHKNSLVDLESEALANAFGDAAKYMTFGGGFGIKKEPDDPSQTDYIFWAGAFNTFFWLDLEDNSSGIFFTAHWPVKYNISDEIEQMVDEARQ